jgi:hypothetical protein
VHNAKLGLSAAANDCHHAVAVLEALGARAAGDNLTGQFKARNVERRTWWWRVGAAQLELIGTVEAGGPDLH